MRRSRADKAATHAKIVDVAAKRFRELGLQGIGIADVMKEAGSSAGGFYRHFESRDDLVLEALVEAFRDLDVLERESVNLESYLTEFLSAEHWDAPATGCAITAFASEMGRASRGVRSAYTERLKQTLGYYAGHLKGGDAASRRAQAIFLLSAGVGGLSLARAVNDKALSREILMVLRDKLTALVKRPLPKVTSEQD